MVETRENTICFKVSKSEFELIGTLAEKSGVKASTFIRTVLFDELLKTSKDIMWLFDFFKKYGSKINPHDMEKAKFSEIVKKANKLINMYEGEE